MKVKTRIGAVYSRVSDDESAAKDRGSTTNQVHIAYETASILTRTTGIEHKIEYLLVEENGQSGGTTNRPQYKVLWNLISLKRIDFVTAKEPARLSRSMRDFIEFMDHCQKNNVSIHIPGMDVDANSPMGSYFFKQMALMGELERNFIIDRTRRGVRAGRINEGKIHGGRVLLGFDLVPGKTGAWMPNHDELKAVERIFDIVCKYGSFKAVCDRLKLESITSKYGSPFRSDSLARLVLSRKYEGILEIKDGDNLVLKDLEFGAVVDLEKLAKARSKILEFQANFSNKTRVKSRTYLLTGLLQHEDGTAFRGMSGTSKTGEKYFYYWSDKHKANVKADLIETAVLNAITCYAHDIEIQNYVSQFVGEIRSAVDEIESQIGQLRTSLKRLKNKERDSRDQILRTTSEVVRESFEEELRDVRTEQEQARSSIQTLECERDNLIGNQPTIKDMKATLRYVFENFGAATPSVQRNFFRQIFDKVVLCKQNQLKLYWKMFSCDFGGKKFALETEWGG